MKICSECAHVYVSEEWQCPACGYYPLSSMGMNLHAPEFEASGEGFRPEFFSDLEKLESNNFWFKSRNELIVWSLLNHKPNVKNFLEVGCGTGFVLSGIRQSISGVALTGSEIFLEGLSFAAKRVPSAKFMQMDARKIPFKEEFDAIGIFDVLEHIEEDEIVLANLFRALKFDGLLILTVPQHKWLWSVSDSHACHVRRYSARDLEKKILSAGFDIVRSTSFVSLLLPAMLASRLMKKSSGENFDPTAELRLTKVINDIFLRVMQIEFALIRNGINFSLGGSRLVVAKKRVIQ